MQELDSVFKAENENQIDVKKILLMFICFSVLDMYVDSFADVSYINNRPIAATHGHFTLKALAYLLGAFTFDLFKRKKIILTVSLALYFIILISPLIDIITQTKHEILPFFGPIASALQSFIAACLTGLVLTHKDKYDFNLKIFLIISTVSTMFPEINSLFYGYINNLNGLLMSLFIIIGGVFIFNSLEFKIPFSKNITHPPQENLSYPLVVAVTCGILIMTIILIFRTEIDTFNNVFFKGGERTVLLQLILFPVIMIPLIFNIILFFLPGKINSMLFLVPGGMGLVLSLTLILLNTFQAGNELFIVNPFICNLFFIISCILVSQGIFIVIMNATPRKYVTIFSGCMSLSYLLHKLFLLVFPGFFRYRFGALTYIALLLAISFLLVIIIIIYWRSTKKISS